MVGHLITYTVWCDCFPASVLARPVGWVRRLVHTGCTGRKSVGPYQITYPVGGHYFPTSFIRRPVSRVLRHAVPIPYPETGGVARAGGSTRC